MRKKYYSKIFVNDNATEVDMTPMLDIVFIMLIFFIVTTSFVKTSGIDLNRPSSTPPTISPDVKSISIQANSNDDLVFNGRPILLDSIQANVESVRAKMPNVGVSVQVEKSIRTGILVRIVDQVRLAGISNVTVSKIP